MLQSADDCREMIPNRAPESGIIVLSGPMAPLSQIEGRFPRPFLLCMYLAWVSGRSLLQRIEQQQAQY